ncbi:CapA family protein [Halorubrum miltondacostae]|uniref:CapA family protein n=1 Tax=Halorubrum miltondacostae TaxID=3076378 RepID=A0ABD5M7J5_9EURY
MVRISAVGDVSLRTESYPFQEVQEIFLESDISIANLETVISNRKESSPEKSVILDSDPTNLQYLSQSGIDLVNIANNHILDKGIPGLEDTVSNLSDCDIEYIGGSSSKKYNKFEIDGVDIGFAGFTESTGFGRLPKKDILDTIIQNKRFITGRTNVLQRNHAISEINTINEDVVHDMTEKIDEECDLSVISLHWGVENVRYPSPWQVEFARSLIDHGADVILGHHPHILQGIEEYNNGLICYSLGNFQFNPDISKSPDDRSVIVNICLDKSGYNEFDLIPVRILNSKPNIIHDSNDTIQLSKDMENYSANLSGGKEYDYPWWFRNIGGTYLKDNIKSYRERIRKFGLAHALELLVWLFMPFTVRSALGYIRDLLYD